MRNHQQTSLAHIEEQLEASGTPALLARVVRKLHDTVNPKSAQYRQVGLASAQLKIYSAVYALCDLNGDGIISWSEVQAFQEIQKALTGDPTASTAACAKAIFSILDKDGDGEITQGEVEYLLQKLGSFGGAMDDGVLEMSQVLVRAGIDMLNDPATTSWSRTRSARTPASRPTSASRSRTPSPPSSAARSTCCRARTCASKSPSAATHPRG